MKQVIISDDLNMISGFRLTGVKGVYANSDNILETLKKEMSDSDNAIIIISKNLADCIRETIDEIKLNVKTPIITEIPSAKREINHEAGKKI